MPTKENIQIAKALRDQAFQLSLRAAAMVLSFLYASGHLKEKLFIALSVTTGLVSGIYYLYLSFSRINATNKLATCTKSQQDTLRNLLALFSWKDSEKIASSIINNVSKTTEEVDRAHKSQTTKDQQDALKKTIDKIRKTNSLKSTDEKRLLESKAVFAFIVILDLSTIIGSTAIPLLFKKDVINTWQYILLLFTNLALGSVLGFMFTFDRIKSGDSTLEIETNTITTNLVVEYLTQNNKLQKVS